jgi:DNA (cytosine-5)-methyltransferase 1
MNGSQNVADARSAGCGERRHVSLDSGESAASHRVGRGDPQPERSPISGVSTRGRDARGTPRVLTVGSLFSGIGGFDLGLQRAGMSTLWFCESDEFCRRVLARHWPGVPCYPDVTRLLADAGSSRRRQDTRSAHGDEAAHEGRAAEHDHVADGDGEGAGARDAVAPVDLLCGGFPCQDISLAGRGVGINGSRSGLWREFARLIGELRPRYVLIENVPALTSRGLDVVLADLAARGFDAEWDHLPASAFGAPHRRDRIWIVAYPHGEGSQGHWGPKRGPGEIAFAQGGAAGGAGLADTNGAAGGAAGSPGEALSRPGEVERPGRRGSSVGNLWAVEPDVGRVAHGIPARVDRLRALGNALVPQIAEWIGRRIIEWEQQAMRDAA